MIITHNTPSTPTAASILLCLQGGSEQQGGGVSESHEDGINTRGPYKDQVCWAGPPAINSNQIDILITVLARRSAALLFQALAIVLKP